MCLASERLGLIEKLLGAFFFLPFTNMWYVHKRQRASSATANIPLSVNHATPTFRLPDSLAIWAGFDSCENNAIPQVHL